MFLHFIQEHLKMKNFQDSGSLGKKNTMFSKAEGSILPFNRSDLPPSANIIGNRFILCIKDAGSQSKRFEARWVLHGHCDTLRPKIANISLMLMRMTFRIILTLAVTSFELRIWLWNVEQAYMQAKKLNRDLFNEPPPKARLPSHQILKIV